MDVESITINIEARGCSTYRGSRNSGTYNINSDDRYPFKTLCDRDTASSGWTVIQRRTDGLVDFFKNWVD